MKPIKNCLWVMIALAMLCACDENEPDVPRVATLRIVNAVEDIGTVDLRGFEGSISFFGTSTIDYGSNFRFTIPVNTPTPLTITPASDTLDVLLDETITLERAGGISSLFLLGDSTQVASFIVEDEITNYQDSVYGVRFINLSADSEPVSIRNIALDTAGVADTTIIASDVAFRSFTSFSQFEATSRVAHHTYEYLDASANVLASVTIPPSPSDNPPYFKNVTICLIGLSDDGGGGNNLSASIIEHFE